MLGIPIIIFLSVCFVCALIFQIILSHKDNRRLGLSIPIIWFLFISVLSILVVVYAKYNIYLSNPRNTIIWYIKTVVVLYTPTIILFIIHLIIRKDYKKKHSNKKEIEVMNIKDL
jgi:pheromone shutdown protein TraB